MKDMSSIHCMVQLWECSFQWCYARLTSVGTGLSEVQKILARKFALSRSIFYPGSRDEALLTKTASEVGDIKKKA